VPAFALAVGFLPRSLQDLVAALQKQRGAGVDLFLHQQALDTGTPSGRAMYGMPGVFAEFERALIVERVNAGLARARAQGTKLGRPKVASGVEERIRALRGAGVGIKTIAKQIGCGVGTVQRVDRELRAAG
jgi:DNA invertase Pin-like site-specific DNA recombinase